MDKEHFLKELGYLLSDVSEEEREAALEYYRDYLDEAGPEYEKEALRELGSPEKVAAEIKWGLAGDREAGEFSERGYRDERFAEDNHVPDKYAGVCESPRSGQKTGRDGYKPYGNGREECRRKKRKSNKRNGILLLLLFVVFGLPLMGTIISAGCSIILAVLGGLLGIFGGLFGLIVGGIAGVFGLLVGGVGMIIAGIVNMAAPPVGLMGICLGFFSLAAGLLLLIVVCWGCGTAVPGFCRFCVSIIGRFCRWLVSILRGLLDKILGRGGAAE